MGILTEVLEVYAKCDVYLFPIDCFNIIKKLNIKVVPYSSLSFDKQKALKEVSTDSYRIGNTIYYNDDKRALVEGRIRFNLMHELGHIVLGHTEESDYNENCANWFAGEILAPTVIIYEYFDYYTESAQSAIVKAFNISLEAADTKIKICQAVRRAEEFNSINFFRPPDSTYKFPYDSESLKIYARFYNEDLKKLIYNVDICPICLRDLYNGEECFDCKRKWLRYGSRSIFDEGWQWMNTQYI